MSSFLSSSLMPRRHHGDELAWKLLVELALALIGDDFAALEALHLARLDDDVSLEVEDALESPQRDNRADGRIAGWEGP